MNPKITVLMSVYNGEKYLRYAIESILNQTYKDFEFLIINDASTDTSRDIILSYKDPRIRLIDNNKNIGLTLSLNTGLRLARGKYIARMDADDVSMPERLEEEIKFMEIHRDHAVVGTFVRILNENSEIIRSLERPIEDVKIREFLKIDNCIAHGSVMIKKECLLDVGLYDESMLRSQDYDLWLRISEKYKLANIPDYLYMWRGHNDNIEAKHRDEQRKFVELAKENALERHLYALLLTIKDNNGDIKQVTKLITDLIVEKSLRSKSKKLMKLFLIVKRATFNKMEPSQTCDILVRMRFSYEVRSILKDLKIGILDIEEAKINLKYVADKQLI